MLLLDERRPLCQAPGCANRVAWPQAEYCSRACWGAAHRKRVSGPCAHCGATVERRPSEMGATSDLFCSRGHYEAWRCARERPTFECRQCHVVKPLPVWAKAQTFCSNRCSGLAQRKRVPRVCPVCSNSFDAEPNEVANNRGKYCSSACRYEGRRLQCAAEVACARCGVRFTVPRSQAERRRFCKASCRYRTDAPSLQTIVCAHCGGEATVRRYRVLEGFGKYCDRRCFIAAQQPRRPPLTCARRGCWKRFLAFPSQVEKNRRFCSRRCRDLARRPKTFRCPVCKERKPRPPGRRPKFCSRSCRNRGRVVRRETDRNARILELSAQGLKAPQIQRQISEENLEWFTSPEAIRQVIHRAR